MTLFERYQSAGVTPPPCRLRRAKPVTIDGIDDGRAFPLSNPPSGTAREIALALRVETAARYRPKTNTTYCNVYAADFARALGVYLPRVWWEDSWMFQMIQEEEIHRRHTGRSLFDGWNIDGWPAVYASNCREIRANELLGWLRTWGTLYGWQEFSCYDRESAVDFAERAVAEAVCVICARNRNSGRSGHVTVVLGLDGEGRVLQSQAGRVCREQFVGSWWVSSRFADVGFFACPLRAGEVSP